MVFSYELVAFLNGSVKEVFIIGQRRLQGDEPMLSRIAVQLLDYGLIQDIEISTLDFPTCPAHSFIEPESSSLEVLLR